MEQYAFYIIIALISLAFAGATILLGWKATGRKFLKYIPAIVAAVVTLALIAKIAWFSEHSGWEALGYAVLAMIAMVVFLASIITAAIIEIIHFRNRNRVSD